MSWLQKYKDGGRVIKSKEKGRASYDPFTDTTYLYQGDDEHTINHEAFHRKQALAGELTYSPSVPMNPSVMNQNLYNRKQLESDFILNNPGKAIQDAAATNNFPLFVSPDTWKTAPDSFKEKWVDAIQYQIPFTAEGEAEKYARDKKYKDGGKINNSKLKQPKFKNDGWLNNYR